MTIRDRFMSSFATASSTEARCDARVADAAGNLTHGTRRLRRRRSAAAVAPSTRRAAPGADLLRRLWPVAMLAGFLLLWPSAALPQLTEGALAGTVTDASGAAIAGARVTAVPIGRETEYTIAADDEGRFRLPLPPGEYQVRVVQPGMAAVIYPHFSIYAGVTASLTVTMKPATATVTVEVRAQQSLLDTATLQTTTSTVQTVIGGKDIGELPLAQRSFANIAYLAPMTEPVEPSDPTKARITAISFAGSSGLNVTLTVDGGNNSDDYIGGFLQNFSPDAVQEFTVLTADAPADSPPTYGAVVALQTRRGTDRWRGGAGLYERAGALNARNRLDNPAPNPKQPFSRQDGSLYAGGPLRRNRAWMFASVEAVRENSSIAYNATSTQQFQALAELAAAGEIPGVSAIAVPTSTPTPYRDGLYDLRLDWNQSPQSQWSLRLAADRNHSANDLVQQGSLPSTGAYSGSNYFNALVNSTHTFNSSWLSEMVVESSLFGVTRRRNSNLGFALAFPFSANYLTTSGFETFGDNQFVTSITAFPIVRKQQKYELRYDVLGNSSSHAPRFGMTFIHEPVFEGELASSPERLVKFDHNPTYYEQNGINIAPIIEATPVTPGANGNWTQNVQRLGFYGEDSWRLTPKLTVNYGLRYDTSFGLFIAEGRDQSANPAVLALQGDRSPLAPGIPHDYRLAFAPRLGFAYAPGRSGRDVLRVAAGMFYNDLSQNGWIQAFQAVNAPRTSVLGAGQQGYVIDPEYKTPSAFETSAGFEHAFSSGWSADATLEHVEGNHEYRRYEYVAGYTIPAGEPSVDVFRTDNRSRYDGFTIGMHGRLTPNLDLIAHYTLASATTWGATVGELFDYVNGVSNPLDAFGPGDHGPSGEDVRHRLVIAGVWRLPQELEVSTLSQFESARPYTMFTPVDVNHDGAADNDRAVVDGLQTSLDQFRGMPFAQVDLRVSRPFKPSEHIELQPFVEFFNLLNRANAGNNYVPDLSALPTPVNNLHNATAFCLNASCTRTAPIASLAQLRVPAGALGDFFGPGTTVGIPFAAQLGFRVGF
jgi:hypothetical protein